MSIAAIRTAIVARLNAVADIGRVHNRERYAAALDQLKQLYYSAPHGQVRGWFVRREATSERNQIHDSAVEHTRWRITGFMAFDDSAASDLIFDALIESVRDAFRADDTLGGAVDQLSVPEAGGGSAETGIQLVDYGPAMFGGVLCHVARLELNTIRYLEHP